MDNKLLGTCCDYTYDGKGIVKKNNKVIFVEGILKDEKIALVDYEEKAVYYIEDTPVSEEDFYKWEHKNTMNSIVLRVINQ